MSKKISAFTILILATLSFANAVFAEEPVSKSFFGGVAIDGRDTVAYHKQKPGSHAATDGKKLYTVEWKGAKWRFANLADSEAFALDPEKYSPAYNGFCANALSEGNGLVKTDGTHWVIFDEQLFLFYAKDGRDGWLDGKYQEYRVAADKAWQEILADE